MIRGGTLGIDMVQTRSGYEIKIQGQGNRIILQQSVKAALEGALDEADLEPRAAPGFLAYTVAKESGGSINVAKLSDTEIEITASLTESQI